MILVDSNVFLIALRYPRDANALVNGQFLERMRARKDGVTSIFNLLEILGILSFNLNRQQLEALFQLFPERFGIAVLPNAEADSFLPKWTVGRLVERVARRLSPGRWDDAGTRRDARLSDRNGGLVGCCSLRRSHPSALDDPR